MAELTFTDGLVLGAILLSAASLILYFGLWFVPAFWLPLVCGWPILVAIAVVYLPLKEWLLGVVRGPGIWYPQFAPRVRQPPPTYCSECGTVLEYRGYHRGYCATCREYR